MVRIKSYTEYILESIKYIPTTVKHHERRGGRYLWSDRIVKTKVDSKQMKILEFIYKSGEEGRRYTDILRFIVEDLNGDKYTNDKRGIYSDNLIGLPRRGPSQQGMLHKYCNKNDNGKWVLNMNEIWLYFKMNSLSQVLSDEDMNVLGALGL
jgi:hypothetical protein